MESSETAGERPLTNLEIQLDRGAEVFGERSFGKALFGDGTLDYFYVRGVILVRDDYLTEVARLLEDDDEPEERGQEFVPAQGLLPGVSLFSVGERDVPRLLDKIDARLGVGVATPNHILSIGPVLSRPEAEPEEVPPGALPDPGVRGSGGAGVFVYLADTGLLRGASVLPWLARVTGMEDPLPAPDGGVVSIPGYAGHGTFAAGVISCLAPQARVYVSGVFGRAGAVAEHHLVAELDRALAMNADVICLPAATRTRKSRALLSFEAFWAQRLQNTGVALVTAAGDGGQRGAWWPARFQWAMGVGALDRDKRGRASFSNYGDGINIYAPGTDLVNTFATGAYMCRVPPHEGEIRHFTGLARWSGTSFAASVAAGLIADRVSKTGENGRQAADSLLTTMQARAMPGVGRVLLTSESAVFISYRREDTAYAAGWLYDRLAEDFDEDHIFKDVDSIQSGDDFAKVITERIGACDALLALIGSKWLTVTDENGRRLDNQDDYVRLEIETALSRGIPVIPILVDGAHVPLVGQLPRSLAGLVKREAIQLRTDHFHSDTDRLREAVGRAGAEVRLRQDRPVIDVSAAPAMTVEEHRREFAAAMTVLIDEFNAYLDRDGADPAADGVSYRQGRLWLSPAELAEMSHKLLGILRDPAAYEPAPGRAPYLLSPILFPAAPPGTEQ